MKLGLSIVPRARQCLVSIGLNASLASLRTTIPDAQGAVTRLSLSVSCHNPSTSVDKSGVNWDTARKYLDRAYYGGLDVCLYRHFRSMTQLAVTVTSPRASNADSDVTPASAGKPWAGVNQPRTATGRFGQKGNEPRGAAIALRLPKSLDLQLRQAAGWQSKADNAALRRWLEAAIAEKLSRSNH